MLLMRAGRIHACIWVLLGLALLARGLVAPGYMPGGVSDGWPVRLCHEGLPTVVLADLVVHHDHHETGGGADPGLTSADLCPLGHGLTSVFLPGTAPVMTVTPVLPRLRVHRSVLSDVRSPAGFRARAPPVNRVHAFV